MDETSADTVADTPAPLRVERGEGIAVVTLDRPRARNALSARLRSELLSAMTALDADPEVRAVVLTGADPAFCAGLDLKELAADQGALSDGFRADAELRLPLPEMDTPVIAAVNGAAITGGFELALCCDFIVASDRARFADTHARVGIMPGWGLTVNLAEAVGIRRAREMSATGNFLDAHTALQWGLVNHVVAHEELLPTARSLASDIADNDPAGVAHVLRTYSLAAGLAHAEARELEARRSAEWLRARTGGDADFDDRRRAVTERGRRQV